LHGQVKVALEVGRIDDGNHHVRPGFAGLLAKDQIDGHHLVGAARRQAVGAGQVNEIERHAGKGRLALLRFNGNAGIIAHALA